MLYMTVDRKCFWAWIYNLPMERLDYSSLARAVDAPMKRWWKRTGWWWLLFPLGALGYSAISAFYLAGSRVNTYGQTPPWHIQSLLGLGEVIEAMPFAALVALWLLAAQHANHLFAALLREANAPRDGSAARFMFLNGLRQGVIPLTAAILLCALVPLAHHAVTMGHIKELKYYTGTDFIFALNHGLDGGFYLAGAMAWLVAIAAVTVRRPYLSWLIVVPVFALPGLTCFVVNTVNNAGVQTITSWPTFRGGSPQGPSHFFYLGLVAVMACVWAFHRRRALVGWIGYGVFLAGALVNSMLVFLMKWVMTPTGPSAFANTLMALTQLDNSLGFTPCRLMSDRAGGVFTTSRLYLPHLELTYPGAYWPVLEAVYILINLAWLILLYWFISLVLLRPARSAPASRSSIPSTCSNGNT